MAPEKEEMKGAAGGRRGGRFCRVVVFLEAWARRALSLSPVAPAGPSDAPQGICWAWSRERARRAGLGFSPNAGGQLRGRTNSQEVLWFFSTHSPFVSSLLLSVPHQIAKGCLHFPEIDFSICHSGIILEGNDTFIYE